MRGIWYHILRTATDYIEHKQITYPDCNELMPTWGK